MSSPSVTDTSAAAAWFTNNVGRASWWRELAIAQCGAWACNEGGVDVPLPAGTPIFALGTGPLVGAGTFTHKDGSPGYGVVTQRIPVVGNVYYQHIDIAPGIPSCTGADCTALIQAGQLVGYSKDPPGEVEVGINPTWGGIWGDNADPSLWAADPRPILKNLIEQGPIITGGKTCTQGLPGQCPTDYTCWPVGKGGAPLCSASTNPLADSRCFPNSQVSAFGPNIPCDDGTGKIINNPAGTGTGVLNWLSDKNNVTRLLFGTVGVLLIIGAIVLLVVTLAGKADSLPIVKTAVKAAAVA